MTRVEYDNVLRGGFEYLTYFLPRGVDYCTDPNREKFKEKFAKLIVWAEREVRRINSDSARKAYIVEKSVRCKRGYIKQIAIAIDNNYETVYYKNGRVLTKKELDKINKRHRLYIKRSKKDGQRKDN